MHGGHRSNYSHKSMKNINSHSGFTLIELMVSVTLIVILSGMSLSNYFQFSQRQAVLNDARNLVTELRKVQAMARNLVYPENCIGLQGYEMQSVGDQSVSVTAVCSSGSFTVVSGEKILVEATLPDDMKLTYGAGSGTITPPATYVLTNSTNNYQVSVVTDGLGNISVGDVSMVAGSKALPTPDITPTKILNPVTVECQKNYDCAVKVSPDICLKEGGYVENCIGGNCCEPALVEDGGFFVN